MHACRSTLEDPTIDVEITQDETPAWDDEAPPERSFDWSGAYRLRWLRPTTEEFAWPMYDGILPPAGYLTQGVTIEPEP